MPAGVVLGLAYAERGLIQIWPQSGTVATVDQYLQWHLQLIAIIQQRPMLAGQARGAGIEVQTWCELRLLPATIQVLDCIAMAHGPVSPTYTPPGLKYTHAEPGAFEFVCGDQAGDTCTEYHHFGSLSGAGKFKFAILQVRRWRQSQCAGHCSGGRLTTYRGDAADHITSSQCHDDFLSVRQAWRVD
ncbi:hypothetical protein D3C85_1281420 [compost metagenome]